jgi:hypothetical protein
MAIEAAVEAGRRFMEARSEQQRIVDSCCTAAPDGGIEGRCRDNDGILRRHEAARPRRSASGDLGRGARRDSQGAGGCLAGLQGPGASRLQAPSCAVARALAAGVVADYGRDQEPGIACFMDDFEAYIAHVRFPVTHRPPSARRTLLNAYSVEERHRLKIIPNAFGERAVLKLMFGPLVPAAERWRSAAKWLPLEKNSIRKTSHSRPWQPINKGALCRQTIQHFSDLTCRNR